MEIHEKNFRFLSEKRDDVTRLFRLSCRELLLNAEEAGIDPYDTDGLVDLYTHSGISDRSQGIELAVFCSECAKRFRYSPLDLITEGEYDDACPELVKIAYLKNSFSDKAFRRISRQFDKASAVYQPGFREVCEEVYYSRSDYALLPVYSSSDGHLSSFRQLITKYDLNIICAVDVETSDEGFMRYALLKKGIKDRLSEGKVSYFDLSVVTDKELRTGEFLASCEFLGASAVSVYTYPSEYSEDGGQIHLTLDVTDADFRALCLFLETSHIRYTPIGVYNVI